MRDTEQSFFTFKKTIAIILIVIISVVAVGTIASAYQQFPQTIIAKIIHAGN